MAGRPGHGGQGKVGSLVARSAAKLPAFNRKAFESSWWDFVDHAVVVSKETGRGTIEPWPIQRYLMKEIFDGLEQGIRWFTILKPRQIGGTTLALLLDVFWCAMFPGLQGAIAVDDGANKDKFRLLLDEVFENLPPSHQLGIKVHNTNGLVFRKEAGGSILDYLVAGRKKGKNRLGQSRGLNFLHADEVASWGDQEGFESLKSALSSTFPNRLYLWVSTAHGYNMFHELWEEAQEDDLTQKAIFVAWWMHHLYRIEKTDPLFARYGHGDLASDEKETDERVKKEFGYTITREQWAWYRHRKDPHRRSASQAETSEERGEIVEVEYPSYPEEAFRMSGSPFLPGRVLDTSMKSAQNSLFKGFAYYFGEEFRALRRTLQESARFSHLKVWQEPHPNGRYIIACDPAYGSGDSADRYCVQVLRAYADRLVQVAEFCVVNIQPFQFAWVICDLCGWYRNARLILEINGPGEAVANEFRHLKTLLDTGRLQAALSEEEAELDTGRQMPSPLANVTYFLYHRIDALTASYAWQWKTSAANKPPMMQSMADQYMLGKLVVNSIPCLVEMKRLVRKGMSIEADSKAKDDRPVALAMGVRCWIDWDRAELDAEGRTFEAETMRDNDAAEGQMNFGQYIMGNLFAQKRAEQRYAQRAARRRGRWDW